MTKMTKIDPNFALLAAEATEATKLPANTPRERAARYLAVLEAAYRARRAGYEDLCTQLLGWANEHR